MIKIGFVAFDPKHLFYPWLFSIEGGPRLLKGVTKIGFLAFDPKHLFYPWYFFGIEGGRGGGGQNYWWGKLSEKWHFSGKIFRGSEGAAKNRPFCQIFRRYGGGQNPILPLDMTLGCICSPFLNSASGRGAKTPQRSDQNRFCGV